MRMRTFQDFDVWNKAHYLTLNIYKITQTYPENERYGLTSQIRRSSVSICANIAEGYTKSTREFARFLEIARASLEETKYHLILSKDLTYINDNKFEELYLTADQIGRMLYGLIKKLN